jgi:hypothetical protein
MAHPDLDLLFDTVLPMAKLLLGKQGEFYPFGATMSPSGEITCIGARTEGDDHPPSQPLIDAVTKAFQDHAAKGQLRAAALCYDVRTIPPGETRKTDAVCCALEHASGESVNVFVPYSKTSDRDVHYREIFATKRTAVFFADRLA